MEKTAVLLLNLGTPETPTKRSVWQYLATFLSDRRVIDLPAPIRYLLLYGLILPFRTASATAAYQKIWTKVGSPLRIELHHLQQALAKVLQPHEIDVYAAMRYGTPDFNQTLSTIKNQYTHLIVLPLFPQYASSTTGSALQKLFEKIQTWDYIPKITTPNTFYQAPGFGRLWAHKILDSYIKGVHDCVMLSYHSLPLKALPKVQCTTYQQCLKTHCPPHARCYRAQCLATSTHIQADLPEDLPVFSSFQSKLGKTPWIGPSNTEQLQILKDQGFKHPLVACPSFVADCIETLEEIQLRLQEEWKNMGGTGLTLVPCLNSDNAWVTWLKDYCLTLT